MLAAARPHRWRHVGWIAALTPAAVTVWLLAQMPAVADGVFPSEQYAWVPSLGLELAFRLDGLALLFGLIVAGIGAGIALYTGYYFEGETRQGYFYALLFLFMASMLGLVWSDNLLGVFVFWEGTSITSYLMIAFKTDSKTAKEGGRRAFIVTGLGGLAMLGGLVLLGSAAGTYSISGMVAAGTGGALADHPYYVPALLLIALGAFTKSAQFPFHFWLPGAMAAPTPASAYLHSATMVKAGIFLLARLNPALGDSDLWFWLLLITGGITMLLGAISALRYRDLKAVLAYATVSQLGVLTMLLALPLDKAAVAVAVGVLAHSLYKGPLFLAAGIVDHATGTRDLTRLAALARPLPLVAATIVLAGLSMAGVPPLLGFLAKEMLLESAHQMSVLLPLLGWIMFGAAVVMGAFQAGAAFMLIYDPLFRRLPGRTVAPARSTSPSGEQAESPDDQAGAHPEAGEIAHVHHAPSAAFVLPALLLAALGAVLPFALEPLAEFLIEPAAVAIAGESVKVDLALWHGFNLVFAASLVALGAGLLIFWQRQALYRALNRIPLWLSGQAAFAAANNGVYDFARWVTRTVQGGTMASQMSVTLLAAAVVASAAFVSTDWARALTADFDNWLENVPPLTEILLAAMAMVAAVLTTRSSSRLGAIISLGVVGVTVTLYFIFFSAPDLALTQLLIEVLTVVLLVLVFFRLGPDKLPRQRRRMTAYHLGVALMMGVFGFTLVLLNAGIQAGEPIYPYFLLNAVPVGNGGNIVNVILVDFRGFDTLGEVTVLGIAAVGGYALLRAPRMAALRTRLVRRLTGRGEVLPPLDGPVSARPGSAEASPGDPLPVAGGDGSE